MSTIGAGFAKLFLARATENERLGSMQLLCEGSDTDGAMAVVRHGLDIGTNGAHPHYHTGFSEMLYILKGSLSVLGDDKIFHLDEGDMAVVPPRMVHAFSATRTSNAEYLLVIAPGIDRFEYHRTRRRLREQGLSSPESLQEIYDNHNVDNEMWKAFLSNQGTAWF